MCESNTEHGSLYICTLLELFCLDIDTFHGNDKTRESIYSVDVTKIIDTPQRVVTVTFVQSICIFFQAL